MQLVCAQDLMKKRSSIVSNYIRLIMEFGYSTSKFTVSTLLCVPGSPQLNSRKSLAQCLLPHFRSHHFSAF